MDKVILVGDIDDDLAAERVSVIGGLSGISMVIGDDRGERKSNSLAIMLTVEINHWHVSCRC
jgi:hypothetical protein